MIRKEWITPWIGPVIFAAAALAVIAIAPTLRREAAIARDVEDVAQKILDRYVDEVDEDEIRYTALEGMMESLDPYSDFYRPDEAAEIVEDNEGKFGGVGIAINLDDQRRLVIVSAVEGKPGFIAGLRSGDWIVAVDDTPTKGLRLVQSSRLIKGEIGTEVVLTIRRPGIDAPEDVTITRAEIEIASVKGTRIIDEAHGIGYVRVTQFQENTAAEFDDAIEILEASGLRSLVLDLRSNPGGVLDGALELAGRFLPEGTLVVSTVGKGGKTKEYGVEEDVLLGSFPLVVLVNEGSASASEILGGALQDHGRGLLVGERTFGKGTVQSLIWLSGDDSLLKLTTSRYLTPNGRHIHRDPGEDEQDEWGLVPDVRVALSGKQFDAIRKAWADGDLVGERAKPGEGTEEQPPPKDTQLEEAVRILRDPAVYRSLLSGAPDGGRGAPAKTAKGER